MRVTRNFGDWHTVFIEVAWSLVLKTRMDCHSKLVLHSLTVQVIMHQPRHTTLLGRCNQTCCSISNMLQLVHDLLPHGRQSRVTMVDVRSDKTQCPVSDEHVSADKARRNTVALCLVLTSQFPSLVSKNFYLLEQELA